MTARYIARSKHPVLTMFLGTVTSTGEVSPPIRFLTGFRLAADAYIDILASILLPCMHRVAAAHGGMPFVFQQDSAPTHRAKTSNIGLRRSGLLTP